jgi:hypothetical protein
LYSLYISSLRLVGLLMLSTARLISLSNNSDCQLQPSFSGEWSLLIQCEHQSPLILTLWVWTFSWNILCSSFNQFSSLWRQWATTQALLLSSRILQLWLEIDPSRLSPGSSLNGTGSSSSYSTLVKTNSDFHPSKPLAEVRLDSAMGTMSGSSTLTCWAGFSSLSFTISPCQDLVWLR